MGWNFKIIKKDHHEDPDAIELLTTTRTSLGPTRYYNSIPRLALPDVNMVFYLFGTIEEEAFLGAAAYTCNKIQRDEQGARHTYGISKVILAGTDEKCW
jgi:hypothetical protein